MRPVLLASTFVCLLPMAAAAQEAAAAAQGTGPMTVQRVHSTFVIAPDFKISRVDGHDARLAGAYGGLLLDEQWLIGAGGYWLTNGSSGRRLGYGGVVLGWMSGTDRAVTISARTLVGWGEGRLTDTVQGLTVRDSFPDVFNVGRQFQRPDIRNPPTFLPRNFDVRFNQQFFVAEPQADAIFRLARWVRLDAGAGYRAIGAAGHSEHRLRGATGSISLQFGSF